MCRARKTGGKHTPFGAPRQERECTLGLGQPRFTLCRKLTVHSIDFDVHQRSMGPDAHVALTKALNLAMPLIIVPLFVVLGYAAIFGDVRPFFALIALAVVLRLCLWLLPVRCAAAACAGLMEKSSIQTSSFKARLQYRCTKCGATHEAEVFQMRAGEASPSG